MATLCPLWTLPDRLCQRDPAHGSPLSDRQRATGGVREGRASLSGAKNGYLGISGLYLYYCLYRGAGGAYRRCHGLWYADSGLWFHLSAQFCYVGRYPGAASLCSWIALATGAWILDCGCALLSQAARYCAWCVVGIHFDYVAGGERYDGGNDTGADAGCARAYND